MSARDATGRLNRSLRESQANGLPPARRDAGMPVWPKDAFDPNEVVTIPPHGTAMRACALWPECDCDTCHLDADGGTGKDDRIAYMIIAGVAVVGLILIVVVW